MASDRDWIVPVAWLLGGQLIVASIMAVMAGHFRRPPFFESLPIAAICVVVAALVVLRGNPTRVFDELHRLKPVLVGGLFVTAQFSILSWCKGLMPYWSGGFWADPMLADWDAILFGLDPWTVARMVDFPLTLEFCYWLWIPLNTVVIYALLTASPSDAKTRCLLSLFSIIAFGSFFQFALPSAGPMFYDLAGWGDRFAGITENTAPMTNLAREWLWRFHLAGAVRPGGGISAMPSMHVAQALWLVFVAMQFCRAAMPVAVLFFVAVCLGSIYLGFHYAVDGMVSIVAMAAIWLGLRRGRFIGMSARQVAGQSPFVR